MLYETDNESLTAALRGVAMRPKRYMSAVLVLGLAIGSMAPMALAFEETTVGGGETKSSSPTQLLEAPKELPKAATDPSSKLTDSAKGISLSTPEVQLTPGTEVRIPGIGSVGVLPKLDFGLELLYGNEQKGPYTDKSGPDDVQLRGTIKHRF